MRWQKGRRSDNVVDARDRSGRRVGGSLSLGGVAVIVIVGLLMGQDPLQILGQDSRPGHAAAGTPVPDGTTRRG